MLDDLYVKQVEDAFIDLFSNVPYWQDIRRLTGLPEERCIEITKIAQKVHERMTRTLDGE